MSLYSHVFARVYDPFLALGERSGMRDLRRETLAAARGRVLEIGAGTGLNVKLYPGAVTAITLAEPDAPMAARLRRRVSGASHPVEVLQAPAEQLPFADGSFDTVVSTLVLFGGLGAWSALAPLDSAAIGTGVVVLENYRKSVDHLEGGIVREVRVTEGQWVNRGDILVALEDVQARAQLEQVRSQLLVGMAREARLIAQRDGLTRVNYPQMLTTMAKDPRASEAMRVQDQTFRVRRQAQQGEIMLYERQIAQLNEKIAGLRQQKTMRDRLVDSYEKERVDFEALAKEGYAERQVFEAGRDFDWNELTMGFAALSLFASRRLFDVRLPTGKPDKDGVWTINAEKAPTLKKYVESVGARFGRVRQLDPAYLGEAHAAADAV